MHHFTVLIIFRLSASVLAGNWRHLAASLKRLKREVVMLLKYFYSILSSAEWERRNKKVEMWIKKKIRENRIYSTKELTIHSHRIRLKMKTKGQPNVKWNQSSFAFRPLLG